MDGIFKNMKAKENQSMSAEELIDKYAKDYNLIIDFNKDGYVKSIFFGTKHATKEAE